MYRRTATGGPLYANIKRELLEKIERGTWPLDMKIPSEDEMLTHYKASRGTVRRALFELEMEGYIRRLAGKGTFVNRVNPRIHRSPGEITSLSQQLLQAGMESVTEVLFAGFIKSAEAEGRVEEGFGISPEAQVVKIRRLKGSPGLPFALQTVYLLPERCPGILYEDLSRLFKIYKEKYDRWIVSADEIIRVSRASREEAGLLQMEPGAPVLIRNRISFDQHDDPLEVLYSVDRGDRFEHRYVIANDMTGVPRKAEPDRPPPRRRGKGIASSKSAAPQRARS